MDIMDWIVNSKLFRAIVGAILLAISTAIWIGGYFWPWGWVVGAILLLISIPERGRRDDGF